jgi:hypothetical protein
MNKIIAHTPKLDALDIMLERQNLLRSYQMFLIGIVKYRELSTKLDKLEDEAILEAYKEIESGE